MELRHLRYFVAVAEALNYRKAADRLRVAQPALSSQIQDLEGEVGVRLLDRNTGGVRLTEAGAAFLEQTRLTLAQAERAVVVAREAEKGRLGRLRIGFFAPLLMGVMPSTLTEFHEKFPEIEVNLVEMTLTEQAAALVANTINIGFAIAGVYPFPPGLQHVRVVRSPICAAMGRDHPLAKVTRVSLADLVREPLLSFAVKSGLSIHGDLMRGYFKTRGLKHGPIRSLESPDIFRATLESGAGVSLLAESGSLFRTKDLVFRPLKETGEDLLLELHALWREGSTSQLVANFIDVMRTVASRKKPQLKGLKPR